jgi:hypothetical protein
LEHAVFLLQKEGGGGILICLPGRYEIQKNLTFSRIQAFSSEIGQAFISSSSKEIYLFLQNQSSLHGFVLLLQVHIEEGNVSLTIVTLSTTQRSKEELSIFIKEEIQRSTTAPLTIVPQS